MRRTVLAGLAAVSVVGVTVATAALAAPSNEHVAAGRNAAAWLVTQLQDDGLMSNGFTPDVGVTIDVLLAMKAAGADAASVTTITDAIATKAAEFSYFETDYDEDGDLDRIIDAGSTAKLLFAAVVAGRDPKAFGGLDVDAMTRELIATDGPHQGRVRDTTPEVFGGDGSNVFDQSLAVLGLAGSGGVPADVVSFLLKQQCPAGGFRLNPPADGAACTDDGQADVDATAMAVQALLVAESGEAAQKGGSWLAGLQAGDGSFKNGPQAPDPFIVPVANTNSTGLAGEALAATGHAEEANKAAAWVAALQWTSGDESGAIAYGTDDFGVGAPDDTTRTAWQRATPQALLGLLQVPLGEIAEVPAGEPSSSGSSSSSPSASVSQSASASAVPGLPITGEPVTRLALSGLGMVLAGVILLVAARRRRSSA